MLLSVRDFRKLLGNPPVNIWIVEHETMLWALTNRFVIPAWQLSHLSKLGLGYREPGHYRMQSPRTIERVMSGKLPDIASTLSPGEYWEEIKPDTIDGSPAYIESRNTLCASFANGRYLIPANLLRATQTGTARYRAHNTAQQILITDPQPLAVLASVPRAVQ